MDGPEMIGKLLREKQPRDATVLTTVPVHARVLEYGVRLWRLWIPAVVADKEVVDRHPAAELVSAHEDVEDRVQLDFLVGRGVDELYVAARNVELDFCQDVIKRRQGFLRRPQIVISFFEPFLQRRVSNGCFGFEGVD